MPDENHNFPFDLFDDGNKNQISVPVANPEVSSDGTRNLRENIQVESADVDNANKENTKKYKPSSEEVADFIEFMLSTVECPPETGR